MAVLSLPGYNNLLDDAAYLGKLADRPELDKILTGVVAMVTQGKELVGLDKTRPWGAMLQTDGQTVFGYGLLPVTNLKKLLAVLEPITGGVESQDGGLFLIKPKRPGQKRFYVKEQAGWAFVSDRPEQLAGVLADPAPLLAGLAQHYEVALSHGRAPRAGRLSRSGSLPACGKRPRPTSSGRSPTNPRPISRSTKRSPAWCSTM